MSRSWGKVLRGVLGQGIDMRVSEDRVLRGVLVRTG